MFLLTLQVTKKTTVGTSEFAQGCEAIGFEGEGVFLQTVDFLVGKFLASSLQAMQRKSLSFSSSKQSER